MLFDARADGENVRIENNFLRRKADVLRQNLVCSRAHLDFSLERVGLAPFIKGHHDHRRAVTANQLALCDEFLFAFLETDRVDDSLALHASESRFDHFPLRAVDHHRHARDIRFAGNQTKKFLHRRFGIEHALVHVDVDDLRAAFDLLARHAHGFFKISREHELGKHR